MTTTLNSHLSALNKLVGQRGQISTERGQLQIAVKIQDARSCYGRTEVLVRPFAGAGLANGDTEGGSGQAWVSLERVLLQ